METKKAYLIKNIEEFGKFIAFCTDNDISVWRVYWDDREKGDRCFAICWKNLVCDYSSRSFYKAVDYCIVVPFFQLDSYGRYVVVREEEIIDE